MAENSNWQDVGNDIAACSKGKIVPHLKKNPELVRDCETLLHMRDTLAGEGVLLPWSGNLPLNTWTGITVGGSPRRVESLGHRPNIVHGLVGTIPAEIGNLTGLKDLSFYGSRLTGPIPPELGNLTRLETLKLPVNQLTGPIPPELGNLANLRELVLAENKLTGSIPPELGRLTSLESLHLFGNQLSGHIPPEIGALTKLRELIVSENKLTGTIPPELGNLKYLELLNIHRNNLEGCIPSTLANNPNLSINKVTWDAPVRAADDELKPC